MHMPLTQEVILQVQLPSLLLLGDAINSDPGWCTFRQQQALRSHGAFCRGTPSPWARGSQPCPALFAREASVTLLAIYSGFLCSAPTSRSVYGKSHSIYSGSCFVYDLLEVSSISGFPVPLPCAVCLFLFSGPSLRALPQDSVLGGHRRRGGLGLIAWSLQLQEMGAEEGLQGDRGSCNPKSVHRDTCKEE